MISWLAGLMEKEKWQLEKAWAINDHGIILGSGSP